MAFHSERELDDLDWRILAELQGDGRLSFKELGRRVNLSSPAVAERVRRLEEAGVITGYRAVVDPGAAGQPITGFIELRCQMNRCLLKTGTADEYPEVVEIHKLSGAHCSMLKVRAASLEHFEGFLERINRHGEMRSSIVLSTQYEGRPVERPAADYFRASRHNGWNT
jgi:Lrp/AsnC family leucine-responsive transcriptional regulator